MLSVRCPNNKCTTNHAVSRVRSRSRALVKRGAREPPLIVNTDFSPPLQVSQSVARRRWPALLEEGRRTGNRVIRPLEIMHRAFVSRDDYQKHADVVEWLKERLQYFPYRHQFNPFTCGSNSDLIETIYQHAKEGFQVNDIDWVEQELSSALDVFEALGELIQGVDLKSNSLMFTIINWAHRFIPMFEEFDEAADDSSCLRFMAAVDKITMCDEKTMQDLCDILTPRGQQDLLQVALAHAQQTGNYLCCRIASYI